MKFIWDISCNDISTLRGLTEMFIACNFLDAHPTEKDPASPTNHLVAPIDLRDWEFAVWAQFRALLDVVQVELLINLSLVKFNFSTFIRRNSDFEHRTALEKVVFFLASQAKQESALGALTRVLSAVQLGRRVTLWNRTP